MMVTVYFAVVTACGIYEDHNRVCLDWTDRRWHASRSQCIARAQVIAKRVKTLTWYAGVKLERSPRLSCRTEERKR